MAGEVQSPSNLRGCRVSPDYPLDPARLSGGGPGSEFGERSRVRYRETREGQGEARRIVREHGQSTTFLVEQSRGICRGCEDRVDRAEGTQTELLTAQASRVARDRAMN